MNRKALCLSLAAALSLGLSARADVITDWNTLILNAIRTNRTSPPAASRQMAILHTAMYDGVNGIKPRFEPYLVRGKVLPAAASPEAAAAAAAHRVMLALYPQHTAIYDAALQSTLSRVRNRVALRTGVEWGQKVAGEIMLLRSMDGAATPIGYTPGTRPGDWQPTPPAFAPALLPQWGLVTPFGLASVIPFRPPPPPALSSAQWAEDCNQVKQLGANNSTERTAEQTLIAHFWANGAGTETPPGHWNRIAHTISDEYGLSLQQNARLFALLNIALADAAILCWDCKFTYNYWRPVTAIRSADLDGNDATEKDAAWTPLLVTPPFPEYTSGHSTFSGAAARVLEIFFGTDDITFTVDSDGTPGQFRTFSKLSAAADESAMSRLYGGIHFNSGNQWGLVSGRACGEYIASRLLLPRRGQDD
jgi:PAP2 superfamily protein